MSNDRAGTEQSAVGTSAAASIRCPHYPWPCPPDQEACCVAYERGEPPAAASCERADKTCPHAATCDEFGCAQEKARLSKPSSAAASRMYYAAIKYPVDASRDEKVTALRNGLELVAMELIEEHGVELDQVQEWLDNAANAAEWSAANRG